MPTGQNNRKRRLAGQILLCFGLGLDQGTARGVDILPGEDRGTSPLAMEASMALTLRGRCPVRKSDTYAWWVMIWRITPG